MAEARLDVLGHELRLVCAPEEARRLEDLAAALAARMGPPVAPETEPAARLALAALALMDELQSAGAALMRARREIDLLKDQLEAARAGGAETPPA